MKYWVFDLDGTLVDSLMVHFQNIEKVFQSCGLSFGPDDRQEILKLSAKTLPVYFETKFESQNSRALQLFRELTAGSFQNIRSFDGIPELLKLLQARGVKLAVWTAREMDATVEILEASGLSSYFSVTVTGNCVMQGKPHPEGLQKVAEHFQCAPDEMIMVGDFDSDMLGAQAHGVKAVRVTWDSSAKIEKCAIAQWQFARVKDMIKWIHCRFDPK